MDRKGCHISKVYSMCTKKKLRDFLLNRQNKSSEWRQKLRRTFGFIWQISGRDLFSTVPYAICFLDETNDTLILPVREAEDSGHLSFGSAHWWSLCCIKSKNSPTYHWNVPQTLSYLFMKEILSCLYLGIPGVCSCGLLEISSNKIWSAGARGMVESHQWQESNPVVIVGR